MAKSKKLQPASPHSPQPTTPRAPTPHLFARISYLYQAAHLLSTTITTTTTPAPATTTRTTSSLARNYIATARTVAKKGVLRLSPGMKRTLCRRCDAVLVPGWSCKSRVENRSRGGRKAWADVLVVECLGCGAVKRFPTGMERRGWKLWCEREDVVVGPGGGGGGA